MPTKESNSHTNNEKTVRCPACDDELLARGLHLHVLRSSDKKHGVQGEIPDDVDLDNAESAGEESVTMDYPTTRDVEQVARLCPYCRQTFSGKSGLMIHLGQMAGRKNHPSNPKDKHNAEDFRIVSVDEDGNVLEVIEEGTQMPSTERRQQSSDDGDSSKVDILKYINELRKQGKTEEANKAEEMLLD